MPEYVCKRPVLAIRQLKLTKGANVNLQLVTNHEQKACET